jgi:hypothetical protein
MHSCQKFGGFWHKQNGFLVTSRTVRLVSKTISHCQLHRQFHFAYRFIKI